MPRLMPATLDVLERDGWRVYSLRNERLRFDLTPALGGKITELVSAPSGRSWLWRNPRLPQRRPRPGGSYIHDFDTGGWDEIFPTIGLCASPAGVWSRAELTDHGELWCRPWTVERAAQTEDGVSVLLALDDLALPVRIEKEICLEPGEAGFEFRYRVTNRASEQVPYIWCSHPLLRAEPGMRLRFPTGTRWRCEASRGLRGLAPGAPVGWPRAATADGAELDLGAPADGPLGWAAKLFTEAMPEGWVEWGPAGGGERMRLSFDPGAMPHLGLWLNLRGWTGTAGEPYLNIGVEPGTSPFDSLFTAAASGTARILDVGGEHRWSLRCDFLPSG